MPLALAQKNAWSLSNDTHHPLALEFQEFINAAGFPCVGAKSALAKEQMRFVIGKDIRSAWDDLRILPNLLDLATSYRADPVLFQSLVVLFEKDAGLDEAGFETNLWARIQSLTDKDEWLGQQPDPRVSSSPDEPHFSLSFGGEAFFVVGLHPAASRPARRFRTPALVFNLHDQFEQLRAQGRYEKLRASIMDRDVATAGTERRRCSGLPVNPGESVEAKLRPLIPRLGATCGAIDFGAG
jgi:FPC/CPF motif-containing protein YcgG